MQFPLKKLFRLIINWAKYLSVILILAFMILVSAFQVGCSYLLMHKIDYRKFSEINFKLFCSTATIKIFHFVAEHYISNYILTYIST